MSAPTQFLISYKSLLLLAVFVCATVNARAVQLVTLDFDTFTDTIDDPEDHVYTPEQREEIKMILEDIYRSPGEDPFGGMFGIKFDILDPLDPPPPFTTSVIKFNSGLFGMAEGIDFRNLVDSDDAVVHTIPTLKLLVGNERDPDLGGGFWTEPELLMPEAITMASAQIAAHELGHALGLRHHDGFGPIGAGIPIAASNYLPAYPGPVGATLTSQHIMGLNSSVSLTADNLLTPSHLNIRSALKLSLAAIENEIGPNPLLIDESEYPMGDASDDVPSAAMSPVILLPVGIPNTLESPHAWAPLHGGPDFLPADIGIVKATIEDRGEAADADHFELEIMVKSHVTVEVISEVNVNTGEIVNPNLAILDAISGAPLPYEGGTTLALDQFESTDAILFDVLLDPGTYVVEVFPDVETDFGDYELLVYAFPDTDFALIGDYNEDGYVDAADYTVWRDNLGTDFMLPNRDPSFSGDVSPDDYFAWIENYGEFDIDALDEMSLSSFSAALPTAAFGKSVPEPSATVLVLSAMLCCMGRRGGQ